MTAAFCTVVPALDSWLDLSPRLPAMLHGGNGLKEAKFPCATEDGGKQPHKSGDSIMGWLQGSIFPFPVATG